MRKIVLTVGVFILALVEMLHAQNPVPTCYRVYFHDKANSPYSVSDPGQFLSQRAIDKRQRFDIEITVQDFPVNPSYVQELTAADPKIQVLATSKWMNTVTIYCPDENKISEIGSFSFVDSIIPVASYKLMENTSVRSLYKVEFQEDSNVVISPEYGEGSVQISMHNGQKLHEEGFRGEGMLVAVIDGGWYGVESCDFYQKMVDEGRFAGMFDLMPRFDTSYPSAYRQAHGTAVTSVMAADDGFMVGTAPAASYAFIHSEYSPTEELIEEDFWARAAEIADSIGADVINSSLGYSTYEEFPQANTDYSTFDGKHSIASLCASILTKKGVIVCIAAGNEGFKEWYHIGKPADAFDVLTVGACSADSLVAGFSSRGYSYDGRVKPDISALGVATSCYYPGNNLVKSNGTSLATPVISGLCACLWQALPEYSAAEIMQLIREKGSQFLTPDADLGYGIPDFHAAYLQLSSITDVKKQCYKVYPNPCGKQFFVENPENDIKEIELFDSYGKIILSKHNFYQDIIKFETAGMNTGIYFGRIVRKNGEMNLFKLLKY